MKNYKVTYTGNASKFKNFETEISANTEREAVEAVYSKYMDSNYFPQDDGTILDCDGDVLAYPSDNVIGYDGGCFSAEEITE